MVTPEAVCDFQVFELDIDKGIAKSERKKGTARKVKQKRYRKDTTTAERNARYRESAERRKDAVRRRRSWTESATEA